MRRAADEVVAVIVDAVRGGAYCVGDVLPSERYLAAQLEVSRPVVSQAMDVLRRAGIVTSRRGVNGGTFVVSLENVPDVLRQLQGPTRNNVRSILETRRGLEMTAGLLAVERATDASFDHLAGLVDDLVQAVEGGRPTQDVWAIDLQFHLGVAESTSNHLLARLLNTTLNDLTVMRSDYPYGHVELRSGIANQRKHLEALRTRDPGTVASAVDNHLAALERVYLGERLGFFAPAFGTPRD
jgi:DNA-binding FadR family transcriptional regulator